MAVQLLKHRSDHLHPGSPSDPRLCHGDPSDQIQVWSPDVGQGYIQNIPLGDDLSLSILDYSLHNTVLTTLPQRETAIEFEFQIAGSTPGHSKLVPHLIPPGPGVWSAQKQQFKVEIFFGPSAFMACYQRITERLSPQALQAFHKTIELFHCSLFGNPAASPQAALSQLLTQKINPKSTATQSAQYINEQLRAAPEVLASNLMVQKPITAEMQGMMHQILSCPYSGRVRRTYLAQKALDLVTLKLDRLEQWRTPSYPLNPDDLDGIYQAGRILADQLQDPPSVEALARQVGLNRFKINQGFHHIYGTTPFRYLRTCRLQRAEQLLMTTKLAIKEIAYRVGYANCSRFANAFHQYYGLNPKTFQLYNQGQYSQHRYSA